MAFMLLAKKRLFSSPHIRPLLLPRFFSSSSTQNPDPNRPFMVNDYLVSTFGFSPAKAATISKRVIHLKSPQNPDAVRHFLQHQGFGEPEIKTIIAGCPRILCSSLQNTIYPNLRALRDMGLSTSALTQIIVYGEAVLQLNSAVPRIKFWRDFLGGQEEALIKAFNANRCLICHDVNKGIAKKISLLQSRGISTNDIRWIICTIRCFIIRSVSTIEDMLKRAKKLGFHPQSGMFKHGLLAVNSVTNEALQKKGELFKSFGWSEEEFLLAVQKSPNIVSFSEKNLQAKMDFLLGEVKCDVSNIIIHPVLLTLSLEKRLRPRYHVLRLLESTDVHGKIKYFFTACRLTENKFVERYIVPHKDKIPKLHEVYLAACSPGSS